MEGSKVHKPQSLGFARQVVETHHQQASQGDGAEQQVESGNIRGHHSSGNYKHYYLNGGAGAVKEKQQRQFAGNGDQQDVLQDLVQRVVLVGRTPELGKVPIHGDDHGHYRRSHHQHGQNGKKQVNKVADILVQASFYRRALITV